MKKFRIKDEDGAIYEVETVEEEKTPGTTDEEIKKECKDDEGLVPEEIEALKRLAAHADELVALITKTDSKDKEKEVEDEDKEVEDEGEKELKDSDEEVIDTDEEVKGKDSKTSVGSLLNKKRTDDSRVIDSALDIENAWAKRYGGR